MQPPFKARMGGRLHSKPRVLWQEEEERVFRLSHTVPACIATEDDRETEAVPWPLHGLGLGAGGWGSPFWKGPSVGMWYIVARI